MNLPLEPFLHLAAGLLALGTYGLLTWRGALASLVSLQIITHAILIALVTLHRGSHLHPGPTPGTGPEPGFADAFAGLVVMLLSTQVVIGVSLILQHHSVRDTAARNTTLRDDPATDR